mmetsp:Transcript_41314/g.118853  ORF Transcript_41314/g.118853 Transcript_41314/m.118853 type:complete len:205 (+) Transcript_41314:120-734(+)
MAPRAPASVRRRSGRPGRSRRGPCPIITAQAERCMATSAIRSPAKCGRRGRWKKSSGSVWSCTMPAASSPRASTRIGGRASTRTRRPPTIPSRGSAVRSGRRGCPPSAKTRRPPTTPSLGSAARSGRPAWTPWAQVRRLPPTISRALGAWSGRRTPGRGLLRHRTWTQAAMALQNNSAASNPRRRRRMLTACRRRSPRCAPQRP